MITTKIPFNGWTIVKDDFIDLNKPLHEQEDGLCEDMFQALSGDLCIDVGWYGTNFQDGNFICFLILNEDWDSPKEKVVTRDLKEVEGIIKTWAALNKLRVS